MAKAAFLGDALLLAAASLTHAAALLWVIRVRLQGIPLDGVVDTAFAKWVPPELWDYLRASATQGVRARRHVPKWRLKAKPHASARENLRQLYEGMWEDSCFGGVLWLSETHEALLQDLMEAHQGCVDKKNPDGTLSGNVRGIFDARHSGNCGTRKEDHPPAPQPRHLSLIHI